MNSIVLLTLCADRWLKQIIVRQVGNTRITKAWLLKDLR